MKISPKQVHQIAKLYSQNRAQKAEQSQKPSMGRDKVDLSTEGREIQALKQRLSEIPDVRREKVAELKAAIESGTYEVSSKDIAEKMLSRSLVDAMVNKEK